MKVPPGSSDRGGDKKRYTNTRPKGLTRLLVKGAAGGMKGVHYEDDGRPDPATEPGRREAAGIDGETGSISLARLDDSQVSPRSAELDAAVQLRLQDPDPSRIVKQDSDAFADAVRQRRSKRRSGRDRMSVDKDAPELLRDKARRQLEDEEGSEEHVVEMFADGVGVHGPAQGRAHLFESPTGGPEPGDPSLTDPEEIARALGTPAAYAKHVMILTEAFRRSTGATRSEAIAYLAAMFVAPSDQGFGHMALKEFGPGTGIIDVYPLEVIEEVLQRYPGFLPKVGFGRLFSPSRAADEARVTYTDEALLLEYPEHLLVRAFALRGGGRPGYVFEPTEDPGVYRLAFFTPGTYAVLVSAVNKKGHTIIDRLQVEVLPQAGERPEPPPPEPYPARDPEKVAAWPKPETRKIDLDSLLDSGGPTGPTDQNALLSSADIINRRERGAIARSRTVFSQPALDGDEPEPEAFIEEDEAVVLGADELGALRASLGAPLPSWGEGTPAPEDDDGGATTGGLEVLDQDTHPLDSDGGALPSQRETDQASPRPLDRVAFARAETVRPAPEAAVRDPDMGAASSGFIEPPSTESGASRSSRRAGSRGARPTASSGSRPSASTSERSSRSVPVAPSARSRPATPVATDRARASTPVPPARSRGSTPAPPRGSRGSSPAGPRSSQGVSPAGPRPSQGVSPAAPRSSQGVSPAAPRPSQGVSPAAPRPSQGSAPAESRGSHPSVAVQTDRGRVPTPPATSSSRASAPAVASSPEDRDLQSELQDSSGGAPSSALASSRSKGVQPVLQESATEAYSGTEYPAEAALSSDELSVLESAVAAFALTHDSLTPQSRVDQETTDPQIRALPPRPAPDGDVADVAAPTATAVRSYDDDLGRPSASGESTPAGRPVRPTGAAPDGASPVERLSNPDPGIDTSQVVPSVPMMVRAEPLVTPPPLQIDPVLPAPPRFAAVEVNDETREIDLDADDATEGLDHEAVLADVTRRVTIDEHGAPVPSAPPAPAGFVDVAPGDQTQQVRRYSDVVDSDPEPTQAEPFDAPERKP